MLEIMTMLQLITPIAEKYKLDSNLIAAIAYVESGGETCATRFEPGWKYFFPVDQMKAFAENIGVTVETEYNTQATSWGLLQIIGTVARENGFRGLLPELCKPEIGLEYGCKYFHSLYKKYGSIEDAISAYNQGSPRKTDGIMYDNEKYVDKVMSKYRELSQNGVK